MKMRDELTCMQCGFVTFDCKDMVLHLACKQRYPEEECQKKVIEITDKTGGKK